MKPVNIAYVGPGMSGRSTSLAQVLNAAGVSANPLTLNPDDEFAFQWGINDKQLPVVATISAARARLYYENVDDPSLDPRVRTDLERLRHAAGILFIVDRQQERCEASLDEIEKLHRDLARRGVDIDNLPIVFQANKSDLDDVCSMEWVRSNLRVKRCDYIESIAAKGIGVKEALSRLLELILEPNAFIRFPGCAGGGPSG